MQYGDTSVKTSYDTYFKDEDTEQEIILYDQQVSKLREWVPGFDDRHLLYRASRDGWYAKDFHSRCDNQGPTLALVQTATAFVFGGYTSVSWTSAPFPGKDVEDKEAFVFSLQREMEKFKPENPAKALKHAVFAGPQFQWALALGHDPMNKPSQGSCFTKGY